MNAKQFTKISDLNVFFLPLSTSLKCPGHVIASVALNCLTFSQQNELKTKIFHIKALGTFLKYNISHLHYCFLCDDTDPRSLESVGGNRIQNWVSKWYCAPLLQAFQTNWTACLGYAAWLEHLTTWHLIARWTFKVHSTTNTLPKYQLIAKKDTWITDDEFKPII